MFEFIEQLNLNITILIVLSGAMILYFGKLISDVRVEYYDKISLYITGLFFTIIYVFAPTLFALYVINYFDISYVLLLFLGLIIIGLGGRV